MSTRNWGDLFDPCCGGGASWRPFRFRSPSWMTSFRNRKWGHPRWRPEVEEPPSCATTTVGIEKFSLYYFKRQRLHRWSLGMDKLFHPTLYKRCNYLSSLGFKSIRVNKMGPCKFVICILVINLTQHNWLAYISFVSGDGCVWFMFTSNTNCSNKHLCVYDTIALD